jgi:hypothetical protein
MNQTSNHQMLPQLPDEIIREIVIIKDQHDQYLKLKQTLKKVPLFAMLKKIKVLEKIYIEHINNNDYEPMEDVILQNTTEIEREQMILINTCDCCDRHQKKKPSIEQYLCGFVPEYPQSPNNNHKYTCNCICRSMSRDICRAQNDEIME